MEKPKYDDRILTMLKQLTWTEEMVPVEPALKFEF
jgi:hypothetical protein